MTMVKISSDSIFRNTLQGINACDATRREATSVTWLKLETNNLHSSRGPDHQLKHRQRVYQHLGVQQALVLVQSKRSRFMHLC
jgi:hypothetical protein